MTQSNSGLFIFLVLTILFTSPKSSAIGVDVNFKAVDAADVDILVGSFSSLVDAFRQFAINNNSVLEQRIDQVFLKFDESMTCAMDQLVIKGKNTIEGSLPDFPTFRETESKACKNSTLKNYGVGGTLDRAIYEDCVLHQYIANKPVKMESVSSGYSGLKEVANAAYCQFKNNKKSGDYIKAKSLFARASILTSGYLDMSTIPGCKKSTPRSLFSCTKKYHSLQIGELRKFAKADVAHVDLDDFEEIVRVLIPPKKKRSWLFFSKEVTSPTLIKAYEDVIIQSRRNVEFAKLSQQQRKEKYQENVPENLKKIDAIYAELQKTNTQLGNAYIKCGGRSGAYCYKLKWDAFSSMIAPIKEAKRLCGLVIKNSRYSDLVSVSDKEICLKKGEVADRRIAEVISYFLEKDRKQGASAIRGSMNDRRPY